MADNGHCTECQVQNSESTCGGKAQSFKSIVGSLKVSDNDKYLKLDLDNQLNVKSGETLITKELWDKIHNILQYIKDYGQIDELNPTQNKINEVSVQQGHITWIQDYNDILNALDKSNINSTSGVTLISEELVNSLKGYIRDYKINETRCDVCNTAGCQVTQCCDDNCCDSNSGSGDDPCYGCSGCDADGERYNSCPGGWESARIYKENIQNYTQNAIELINSINIVEFNYKNDPEKNQKIGFIADDTDAQLASKNHNIMDMYNCIGVLLKAVQELSAEIKKLKNKEE